MKTTNLTTKGRRRMSAEERCASIIEAVMPVFAQKGYAAATTRDLAKAAGISEALLYRHFPSKESLYANIQMQICSTDSSIHDFVTNLKPGSESIVKLIYMVFKIILETRQCAPEGGSICRIMIQSLLENGDFARSFIEPRFKQMLPYMEEFAEAALQQGEMAVTPLSHKERKWFPHHLAVALRLSNLPEEAVFDYDSVPEERLLHAVWFSLRGIGLKDEVIERYLKPEILDPEINDVLVRAGLFNIQKVQ